MNEEWRSLKGLIECGDYYEVSNLGRVRSIGRGKWKIRKANLNTDKYLQLRLHFNKKQKVVRVHQLVALAFIPKPNDYEIFEVNHIDKCRTNNVVTNLEWVSHATNVQYSSNKKIKCYTYPKKEFVKEFESITKASDELKVARQLIGQVCLKKYKHAGNYYFEYAD